MIQDSTYISRDNSLVYMVTPIYTHKNIQLHDNNEMFNNRSTVGPSQKSTVIVTKYMGTLLLFLESVQGVKSVSVMEI